MAKVVTSLPWHSEGCVRDSLCGYRPPIDPHVRGAPTALTTDVQPQRTEGSEPMIDPEGTAHANTTPPRSDRSDIERENSIPSNRHCGQRPTSSMSLLRFHNGRWNHWSCDLSLARSFRERIAFAWGTAQAHVKKSIHYCKVRSHRHHYPE